MLSSAIVRCPSLTFQAWPRRHPHENPQPEARPGEASEALGCTVRGAFTPQCEGHKLPVPLSTASERPQGRDPTLGGLGQCSLNSAEQLTFFYKSQHATGINPAQRRALTCPRLHSLGGGAKDEPSSACPQSLHCPLELMLFATFGSIKCPGFLGLPSVLPPCCRLSSEWLRVGGRVPDPRIPIQVLPLNTRHNLPGPPIFSWQIKQGW